METPGYEVFKFSNVGLVRTRVCNDRGSSASSSNILIRAATNNHVFPILVFGIMVLLREVNTVSTKYMLFPL